MIAQRVRLVFLLVVVDAILLVAAFAVAHQGASGLLLAADFLVIAVLAAVFVVVALSPRRGQLAHLTRSDSADEAGVGLSNSRVIAGLLLGLAAAFVVLPVALALLWSTTGDQPGAAGPLLLLAITVLGGAPLLVGLLRGRYHLGGLEVTASGVRYTSYLRQRFLAWDDVALIRAGSDGRIDLLGLQAPTVTGPSPGRVERPLNPDAATTASDGLQIPTGLLRTNSAALRRLLEHYRTHPRDRPELTDGSALRRFGRTSQSG